MSRLLGEQLFEPSEQRTQRPAELAHAHAEVQPFELAELCADLATNTTSGADTGLQQPVRPTDAAVAVAAACASCCWTASSPSRDGRTGEPPPNASASGGAARRVTVAA
eukprot:scaffold1318_cov388-Prasinococcus_capsulatus_cf.AAC.26